MKEGLKKFGRNVVKGAMYIYLKLVYGMKVEGTEFIPKEGALLFCGNHRSYLDPPIIEVTSKRELHFLAKEELYKNKFLKFLSNFFSTIPVKRNDKDIEAIKTSLKALKKGECIALFPEGTRNGLEKGEKVKEGVAFLSLNSDAKVIPVGISGGEKPFKKVVVHYGKPLDFSEYKNRKKEKEILEKVTANIMDEIIMLTNKNV